MRIYWSAIRHRPTDAEWFLQPRQIQQHPTSFAIPTIQIRHLMLDCIMHIQTVSHIPTWLIAFSENHIEQSKRSTAAGQTVDMLYRLRFMTHCHDKSFRSLTLRTYRSTRDFSSIFTIEENSNEMITVHGNPHHLDTCVTTNAPCIRSNSSMAFSRAQAMKKSYYANSSAAVCECMLLLWCSI